MLRLQTVIVYPGGFFVTWTPAKLKAGCFCFPLWYECLRSYKSGLDGKSHVLEICINWGSFIAADKVLSPLF